MRYKNLYIAATSQHVGKTTSTLGLLSAFKLKGIDVGYCKPVGQRHLLYKDMVVDKDALLFADILHFDLNPAIHSPVILGKGATTAYLDDPGAFHYEADILRAAKTLTDTHEFSIFEGTGHPGVGSVVGLSNADVAHLVNAQVIMVVEGGIGSTIDMLNMSISLFRERGVPILGVIINKTMPEKLEKVKHYVGKSLAAQNLPLLGVLPYDQTLAYPLMKSVADATHGTVTHNSDKLNNKVADILAGSLMDVEKLRVNTDLLLVVSTQRLDEAIKKIQAFTKALNLSTSPLVGIVATGHGTISPETENYVAEWEIPLIRTMLDTYGSVIKISRIEVKINSLTPWKVDRAIELINQNVDLDFIMTQSREG
ncbi:MAG: AAA family ATPase [Saprospiraceae bacterium]